MQFSLFYSIHDAAQYSIQETGSFWKKYLFYLRFEELSFEPYISLIHDLMYEPEIKYYKQYASGTALSIIPCRFIVYMYI